MGTELALSPRSIAVCTDAFTHVQDDCDSQHVMFFSQVEQRSAGFHLYVCGVNDGEVSSLESLGSDEVQHVEGRIGGLLIVFIIAHQPPTEVRRDDLSRQEMLGT